MSEFYKISYQLQENTYVDSGQSDEIECYRNWFENGTVDLWRHLRMLDFLDVFLIDHKQSSWLTLGDGRFGTSATYIEKRGGIALATDIDTSLLKLAEENKMIKKWSYENAESLSFSENSFDYAFCKEAYHHFPRAHQALYEMLRVSRKAVMLVEPNDWLPLPVPRRVMQLIKNTLKKIAGRSIPHPDEGNFEPVGNYVFTVSKREIQKMAGGMGLPCVAFKEFTDIYFEGVEGEKTADNGPLFRKIKKKIRRNFFMCKLGLGGKNRIITIIFKEAPGDKIRTKLRENNFEIINLPENPFVKNSKTC
jgi:ubiquinone/menaquinone biosynthesis C-methylase UbiE